MTGGGQEWPQAVAPQFKPEVSSHILRAQAPASSLATFRDINVAGVDAGAEKVLLGPQNIKSTKESSA